MTICFATNNRNKLEEITYQLGNAFKVVGLEQLNHTEELPEDQDTLEGNSAQKAWFVYDTYKVNCFADDTGLLVTSLNNDPGVNSARYAGPEKDSKANMALLLKNLEGKSDRTARFITVITLVQNGEEKQFTGEVAGSIIEAPRGSNGFGYDPVFVPEGYTKTFAELSMEEKNKISHRSRAFKQLIEYLKSTCL